MSGAGSEAAGIQPAGHDAVLDPTERALLEAPHATYFNPGTADFKLTADAAYDTVHPVDQKVALALTVRKGTLPSAPDVGNTLHEIVRAGGPTLLSDVESRIRTAVQTMLNAGDITLNKITVVTPYRGNVSIYIAYTNLRLVPAVPRVLNLALG